MSRAFEILVNNIQTELKSLFHRKADRNPGRKVMTEATEIPWSWVAVSIAAQLHEYPTGLTKAVLLSILEINWEKTFLKRFKGFDKNFSSIQAVYDTNTYETFLLEVKVRSWNAVQQGDNYIITVVDDSSSREMDVIMQPKMSQWIKYEQDKLFFKDRKIRIICPPKANQPVINKYHDDAFPREHRVALAPPTENMVIILDRFDQLFVQKEFPHKVRDIKNVEDESYRFWLKIIHVEHMLHVTPGGQLDGTKLTRTDVYLTDMSSECRAVILSLFDDHASLSSIFKRNDYLGVCHPLIRSVSNDETDTVFDYADKTVLFLMPEKEAQEAGLAKINLSSMAQDSSPSSVENTQKDIVERDEEGFLDCEKYLSRIHIKDLNHCMLNLTLYGKVVGLAKNNPYIKSKNQKMDRYALRIADATGSIDITLWEESGKDSRKLRTGHYVLLEGLSTSDKHESENKRVWYVNGSSVCGTRLYNISTLSSLLTSAAFRAIVPLWYAKEANQDQFQVEGIIVGWQLYVKDTCILTDTYTENIADSIVDHDLGDFDSIGQQIVALAHGECLLELNTENQTECEFCGCQIENNVVQIFRPAISARTSKRSTQEGGWIEWRLDDGTSTCNLYGGDETLLNATANHFRLMSHQSQIKLLDSVIGLSVLCTLTGTTTSTYRLDQMTLLEPTQQECRDMLERYYAE